MLFLLFTGALFAQHQDTLQGTVSVIADPRIDKILEQRLEMFLIDSTTQGYRLQILAITDHKEATMEMENFQLKYPEIPIYIKYNSPNFKLRVGDFSSKVEAHYWFAKLRAEYPNLFLVPDKVNPSIIQP